MRCTIILLTTLLTLTGCRDEAAATRAAQAARVAEEARIEREVARRLVTERKALSERKVLLRTIRVVGFVVLTGGAVYGLVWLRQPRGSNSVGSSTSIHHPLSPPAIDHYPVNPGRVLDLHPSPPTHHRRRNHETAPRA